MDETACWMDMPLDTTVTLCGERSVPVKSTGHEKSHFTVVLTARANGSKMQPFVVFSTNGWMNDALTIDYLCKLLGLLFQNTASCMGCIYRCHTSAAVRAETARLPLHTAIVPGGCTKFIQVADIVWNACFKSNL